MFTNRMGHPTKLNSMLYSIFIHKSKAINSITHVKFISVGKFDAERFYACCGMFHKNFILHIWGPFY